MMLCAAVALTGDTVEFCCCVTTLKVDPDPGLYKNVRFALNIVLAAEF